jgi:anti-sigma regulatory factor (Ser/Thr protein kinase)
MSVDPCKDFHKLAFCIPGNRGAIKHLLDEIIQILSGKGFKIDGDRLKLVLSEALTNALLYGSLELSSDVRESRGDNFFWQLVDQRERDKKYASNEINLRIECVENALRFRIEDKGKGFDWYNFMKKMASEGTEIFKVEHRLKTHGRGLWIIKKNVDALRWNKRGNEITFTIKLPVRSP